MNYGSVYHNQRRAMQETHLHPNCTCKHRPGDPCNSTCPVHRTEPPMKVERFFDRTRGCYVVSLGANGYLDVYLTDDEDKAEAVYAFLVASDGHVHAAVWDQRMWSPWENSNEV